MDCSQIREKLAQYQDGECTCYERKEIAAHLWSCPECRKALHALHELTALLWELPSQTAPPHFLEEIMSAIQSPAMPGCACPAEKAPYKHRPGSAAKTPFLKSRWETLRDLALAAAVSLGIFWYGGAWFDNENIMSAGSKLDLAFKSYVQYSGHTLDRVYSNVEDLNGTILKER